MLRRSLIAAALIAVASPLAAQEEWVWTSDRPDGNAPLGVFGARTMGASEIQFTYRFSQMNSMGVWFGTDSLGIATTLQLYSDAPLTHTDQNHLASLEYGLSENLTLLVRGSYHVLQRETFDGGTGSIVRANTNAVGDVEVGALYSLYHQGPYRLDVQVGGTVPVGDTRTTATVNGVATLLPYDMRPGAGAYGVTGGISGGIQNEVASVGGQFRMWTPVADTGLHQLGRSFEGNAWAAYMFTPYISGSAGVRWQSWDHLSGADPVLVLTEDPGNVGTMLAGQRAMLPIGINFLLPEGSRFAGNRLSIEAVYAMHHDYEGPQLGLDWGLNVGWTIGF